MDKTNFEYEFEIPARWSGRALKSILQSELKFSARLLRNMKPYQQILKNGKQAYLKDAVWEGDKIFIMLPSESSEVTPEAMNLDIRYEDHEVIVLNKPPGVLTHPTAREREGSLLAGVLHYLLPQHAVPHSVHRLDRDTSGVVMFAKHAHMHHLFDIALRAGAMHRTYCALVWHEGAFLSAPEGEWDTIELPIGIDPKKPSRRIITAAGQRAVTHYRVLGKAGGVSAVQIVLETGRTHQIRLHFSAMGMPLVGDPAYGRRADTAGSVLMSEDGAPFNRQALHAVDLNWVHPITALPANAKADVAADMQSLWSRLGGLADVWTQAMEPVPPAVFE